MKHKQQSIGERMSDQAPVLDPKRTALLVMDFQQGILRRMSGLEPLVARVQRAQIIDTATLRGLLSP
jgi:hypothetical protein